MESTAWPEAARQSRKLAPVSGTELSQDRWLMSRFIQPAAGQSAQRDMALEVLGAALDAVDPAEAIRRAVRRDGDVLYVAGQHYDLSRYERVLVIGGGKAGAPMAAAMPSSQSPSSDRTKQFLSQVLGH